MDELMLDDTQQDISYIPTCDSTYDSREGGV